MGTTSRLSAYDDCPFIVLAETKPSKRHIPVWARYSPLNPQMSFHTDEMCVTKRIVLAFINNST